jgi:secretory carrier-associated membrane protein
MASQPQAQQPVNNYQQPNPPPYRETSAEQIAIDQLAKQQEEMNRRAAELDRRERLANQPVSGQPKNFPPLPGWCPGPLKPCFFQDISMEIPIEFQKWVRMLFYLWSCK